MFFELQNGARSVFRTVVRLGRLSRTNVPVVLLRLGVGSRTYCGLVTLALVGLAPALLQACLAESCTEKGCHSGVTVNINSISNDEISEIHACLDDECTDLPWTPGAVCTNTNGESPNLSACGEGDSLELMVFASDVEDGNVLSIRVDGDYAVLLDEKRTLRYDDSYPNGKDCPGHCRIATVKL